MRGDHLLTAAFGNHPSSKVHISDMWVHTHTHHASALGGVCRRHAPERYRQHGGPEERLLRRRRASTQRPQSVPRRAVTPKRAWPQGRRTRRSVRAPHLARTADRRVRPARSRLPVTLANGTSSWSRLQMPAARSAAACRTHRQRLLWRRSPRRGPRPRGRSVPWGIAECGGCGAAKSKRWTAASRVASSWPPQAKRSGPQRLTSRRCEKRATPFSGAGESRGRPWRVAGSGMISLSRGPSFATSPGRRSVFLGFLRHRRVCE